MYVWWWFSLFSMLESWNFDVSFIIVSVWIIVFDDTLGMGICPVVSFCFSAASVLYCSGLDGDNVINEANCWTFQRKCDFFAFPVMGIVTTTSFLCNFNVHAQRLNDIGMKLTCRTKSQVQQFHINSLYM